MFEAPKINLDLEKVDKPSIFCLCGVVAHHNLIIFSLLTSLWTVNTLFSFSLCQEDANCYLPPTDLIFSQKRTKMDSKIYFTRTTSYHLNMLPAIALFVSAMRLFLCGIFSVISAN